MHRPRPNGIRARVASWAATGLRVGYRYYLPPAAGAVLALAVAEALATASVSRAGVGVALVSVGVALLALEVRLGSSLLPGSVGRSRRTDDGTRESEAGLSGRRPDLNHRFLPLQVPVQVGELRSGGPVVAVFAVPGPALTPAALSVDPGPRPVTGKFDGSEPPAPGGSPRPFWWALDPVAARGMGAVDPSRTVRSGAAAGAGALWAEVQNPWPPHLRAPIEERFHGRVVGPFERRLPRGRLGRFGAAHGPTLASADETPRAGPPT